MPRVYLSEKEAIAVLVVLENYMTERPLSCTSDMVRKVPERLRVCIDLQCKRRAKKDATPKSSAEQK